MYLIVGLGNPDKKYLNTFHNVGFMCVDLLADKLGETFTKSECKAMTLHTRINGHKVIVAKPLTYMNLSGESVVELVNKYKIEIEKVIVVYDDVDLPMGTVRIRKGGSGGTHNGMRNIIKLLGETGFARVRLGIDKPTPMELVDFVLSAVSDEDKKVLKPAFQNGVDALYSFASGNDIERVMHSYNLKLPTSK